MKNIEKIEGKNKRVLSAGKLDSKLLKRIVFEQIKFRRPEVITRPGIGEDCAVVDFGQYECVLSTDPITAAIQDVGRLSVHISCNDIAAKGVEPLGILLTILLPIGTLEEEVEQLMSQAAEAAHELGVEIVGGHTEITSAVTKPVIVSTALGRGEKDTGRSQDMKPGAAVLMTKTAGLEGTGIIAGDHKHELMNIMSPEEIQKAESLLSQVSVVKEGVIAGKIGAAGMHDITEGGVLGAVWELCQISGLGAELWGNQIPVESVTLKICKHYNLNYLRLISSGCMMIIVSPDKKEKLMEAISKEGIAVSEIGIIKDLSMGIKILEDGQLNWVKPPQADEIYKVVG